jgi:hypothetical protein
MGVLEAGSGAVQGLAEATPLRLGQASGAGLRGLEPFPILGLPAGGNGAEAGLEAGMATIDAAAFSDPALLAGAMMTGTTVTAAAAAIGIAALPVTVRVIAGPMP